MAMFDPTNGPFPYEVEFAKGQEFSKAHVLADIMGFYRAFGVEPLRDRADSIDAELEFMHLLLLKEHHAMRGNDKEKAEICREAQEKFFGEHLGALAEALLEALRDRGDSHAFYDSLHGLLEEFMKAERAGFSSSSCEVSRKAVP
jgi:TorA maturation chaperone TorD